MLTKNEKGDIKNSRQERTSSVKIVKLNGKQENKIY